MRANVVENVGVNRKKDAISKTTLAHCKLRLSSWCFVDACQWQNNEM